ncbi:hypothetical protein I3842_03G172800 [Carya illinoinensis]|uniref:Uncharacterized protein n=1 Tax=Carya illinoinensis TaxID=32201 RepID=A0A922K0E7_CARIL|nr:hypothetical protein I3842_03G172800 [Carya illinoinensis]
MALMFGVSGSVLFLHVKDFLKLEINPRFDCSRNRKFWVWLVAQHVGLQEKFV